MNVAIVGSRCGMNPRDFEQKVLTYISAMDIILHGTPSSVPPSIITGGAQGIDSLAATWAMVHRLETRVFQPDWTAHGKSAGVMRNQQIVDAADYILAFWDGQSKGTNDTIGRALRSNKPLTVVPINNDRRDRKASF